MAKIIVTDDAILIRDMLGEIASDAGHTVIGAQSGEELLDLYEKEKPDVVFLDVVMEDDGLETLGVLMDRYPDAKVVICSAIGGMDRVVNDALNKGAITCIRKPFGEDDVLEAIDKCLK